MATKHPNKQKLKKPYRQCFHPRGQFDAEAPPPRFSTPLESVFPLPKNKPIPTKLTPAIKTHLKKTKMTKTFIHACMYECERVSKN